ncbi:MAG TPA: hypothetical protein VGO86_02795 [Candidatus Dormibacteraeota bacterium]|jgi:hypothetical protein
MRSLALLLAPLVLVACSGTAPSATPGSDAVPGPTHTSPPVSTPSAAAPSQSLAVLVDFPTGTGPQSTGYDLALVAADGHVAARAHAAARTFIGTTSGPGGAAAIELPEVSAANGRVYYLDGDRTVRYLTPAGSTGTFATIPGSSTAHAAFAVSPDGQHIAVSVLTYQGNSATVSSLAIHDVTSGIQHDIAHPAPDLVWPVAWHGADLVLATFSTAFSQQGLVLNPYGAAGYQVVNPTAANRVATIGGPDFLSACQVTGLLVPAGTSCYHLAASHSASELWQLSWSGARSDTITVQRSSVTAALGPDQTSVAICCGDATAVILARGQGNQTATALKGNVDSWPCWLDTRHLLAGSVNDHQFQPSVLDLGSSRTTPVDAHGFCAAVLGSSGASGEPM